MDDAGMARLGSFRAEVGRLAPGSHEIDLSKASFLCPAACAFMTAVRDDAAKRGVFLQVDGARCSDDLARHLEMSQVIPGERRSRTTVPVRIFPPGSTAFGAFLRDEWLPQLRDLTAPASEYVQLAMGEIFANAFQHSRSEIGVASCGQYFAKTNELHLTVLDLGIGIPATVAAGVGVREHELDPEKAIRWAFQPRNSSVPTSRGFGLAILSKFVSANGGGLKVYSGRGYAEIGALRSERSTAYPFPGTVVDVIVRRVLYVPGSKEELF